MHVHLLFTDVGTVLDVECLKCSLSCRYDAYFVLIFDYLQYVTCLCFMFICTPSKVLFYTSQFH